jgi:2-iminobutanoate/2-iminopropanoate deaminase
MAQRRAKQVIHTDLAPKAIGPYSQGVRTADLVFTAGQIGLDPATSQLAEGGIMGQTRQVLANLKHVLQAADSGLEQVVKTTVYLQDINDFAAMNEVYAEFFSDNAPARSTVAVAGLPKGALVEIEVTALTKSRIPA